MLYFVAFCACLLGSAAQAKDQHFPFDAIFGNGLLTLHGLEESSFHALVHAETQHAVSSASHATDRYSYLTCGPVMELKSKREELLGNEEHSLSADHVRTVYQSRSKSTGCLLVHAPRPALEAAAIRPYNTEGASAWAYTILPAFLKASPSVVNHLNGATDKLNAKLNIDSHPDSPSHIEVAMSLGALRDTHVTKHAGRVTKLVANAAHGFDSSLHTSMSFNWRSMASSFGSRAGCAVSASKVRAHADMVMIHDVHEMSKACLSAMVEALAADPAVNNIRYGHAARTLNHDSKGMLETGQPAQTGTGGSAVYPYTQAGLNGNGQIIAVMDTGLDDLSCYFADDVECSGDGGTSCLTPRDGLVYNDRRKVIQYVPYADETDTEAGHGSHVTGTILGAGMIIDQNPDMYTELTNSLRGYSGIAANAKVAFQDIGDERGDIWTVYFISLSEEAFPVAYRAGARVHSNSWGLMDFGYDMKSYEVDKYTYENDDFLVVASIFSEGNVYGIPLIGNPANAKNALTVGSAQVRNEYTDMPFDESTMSSLSSNGPTMEGRIKPDIVSAGSAVTSCRSNDPMNAENAYNTGYSQLSCQTMQASGTSSATATTSGGALLVRQYFEDATFWAAYCDSDYSSCSYGAFSPSGYFVKAAMLHSGTPMSRFGAPADTPPMTLAETPNVFEGYGMATLSNVLPLPALGQAFKLYANDAMEISQGYMTTWEVEAVEDNVTMRATLVWYDPYSEMNGNLIHNLDLRVVAPDGTVYWGNGKEGDEVNPNEQVTVEMPRCSGASGCTYLVQVGAMSVSMAKTQKFALLLTTSGAVSEPVTTMIPMDDDGDDLFNNDDYVPPSMLSMTPNQKRTVTLKDIAFKAPKVTKPTMNSKTGFAPPVKGSLAFPGMGMGDRKATRQLDGDDSYTSTVVRNADGTSTMTVEFSPFTASAGGDPTFFSIPVPAGLGALSHIDYTFADWTSTTACPYATYFYMVTGSGSEVSSAAWPMKFAMSCFAGIYPYTLGTYTATLGAAPFEVSVVDADVFTMAFIAFGNEGTVDYNAVTAVFNFVDQTDADSVVFASVDLSYAAKDEEWLYYEFTPELSSDDVADGMCWRPAYFQLTLKQNNEGACTGINAAQIIDPSGRGVSVLDLTNWISDTTYDQPQFIRDSGVQGLGGGNEGVWTIGLYNENGNDCPDSDLTGLVSFVPVECYVPTYDGVLREVDFMVTLDSCSVPNPDWVGDGVCNWDQNAAYNTDSCAWDGGDCCEETCEGENCGSNGYVCKDPEYRQVFSGEYSYSDMFSEETGACLVGVEAWIGDGYCDQGNYNSPECDYDGGDCCEESCTDGTNACGVNGYNCLDPAYNDQFSAIYSYSVEDYYSGEDVYSVEYSGEVYSGEWEFTTSESTETTFESRRLLEAASTGDDGDDDSMPVDGSREAIILIDSFEQEGNLEYVSIALDGNYSQAVFNYGLGILIIDPVGRIMQVGSYDHYVVNNINSGTSNWPSWWEVNEMPDYTATRDVRPAGLSSLDYDNVLSSDARRLHGATNVKGALLAKLRASSALRNHIKALKQKKAHAVKVDDIASGKRTLASSNIWEVYLVLAEDVADVRHQTYKGSIELKFDAEATFAPSFAPTITPTAVPSTVPTAVPTTAPTPVPTATPTLRPSAVPTTARPTARPTPRPSAVPTHAPTGPKVGTYVEFNTTIEYDNVDCDTFVSDAAALEAAREATLSSLNDNMEDEEVKEGVPDQCVARRLSYSNVNARTIARGLNTVTMVSFTTRANIDNLGEDDPQAVYEDMINSLNTDILSGDYTDLVQAKGVALNTSTLSTVSVTELPTYTELVVFEVSGGSSGDDDDDQTGLIVGVVIGGFVFLVIVAGAVYWFIFRETDEGENGMQTAKSESSGTSTHTATVGGSGAYKKGTTNDDPSLYDNPIFNMDDKGGGKAEDNYGGL